MDQRMGGSTAPPKWVCSSARAGVVVLGGMPYHSGIAREAKDPYEVVALTAWAFAGLALRLTRSRNPKTAVTNAGTKMGGYHQ